MPHGVSSKPRDTQEFSLVSRQSLDTSSTKSQRFSKRDSFTASLVNVLKSLAGIKDNNGSASEKLTDKRKTTLISREVVGSNNKSPHSSKRDSLGDSIVNFLKSLVGDVSEDSSEDSTDKVTHKDKKTHSAHEFWGPLKALTNKTFQTQGYNLLDNSGKHQVIEDTFKNATPESMENIPLYVFKDINPHEIASLKDKAFLTINDNQFESMSKPSQTFYTDHLSKKPQLMKKLDQYSLSHLPDKAFSVMTSEHINNISPEVLLSFSNAQYSLLPAEARKAFSEKSHSEFKGLDLTKLRPSYIATLPAAIFKSVTPDQIKELPAKFLLSMTKEQASKLSYKSKEAFTTRFKDEKILKDIPMHEMPSSGAAYKYITFKHIQHADPQSIFQLTREQYKEFRGSVQEKLAEKAAVAIHTMKDSFLEKLQPSQMKDIPEVVFSKMDVVAIKRFSPEQLLNITEKQHSSLRVSSKNALLAKLTMIPVNDKLMIAHYKDLPKELKLSLAANALLTIHDHKIENLPDMMIREIRPKHIAYLSGTAFISLSSAQIKKMPKETQKEYFKTFIQKPQQMAFVTADALLSMPRALFARMTPTHIEHTAVDVLNKFSSAQYDALPHSSQKAFDKKLESAAKEMDLSEVNEWDFASFRPNVVHSFNAQQMNQATPELIYGTSQEQFKHLNTDAKKAFVNKYFEYFVISNRDGQAYVAQMYPEMLAHVSVEHKKFLTAPPSTITPAQLYAIGQEDYKKQAEILKKIPPHVLPQFLTAIHPNNLSDKFIQNAKPETLKMLTTEQINSIVTPEIINQSEHMYALSPRQVASLDITAQAAYLYKMLGHPALEQTIKALHPSLLTQDIIEDLTPPVFLEISSSQLDELGDDAFDKFEAKYTKLNDMHLINVNDPNLSKNIPTIHPKYFTLKTIEQLPVVKLKHMTEEQIDYIYRNNQPAFKRLAEKLNL